MGAIGREFGGLPMGEADGAAFSWRRGADAGEDGAVRRRRPVIGGSVERLQGGGRRALCVALNQHVRRGIQSDPFATS